MRKTIAVFLACLLVVIGVTTFLRVKSRECKAKVEKEMTITNPNSIITFSTFPVLIASTHGEISITKTPSDTWFCKKTNYVMWNTKDMFILAVDNPEDGIYEITFTAGIGKHYLNTTYVQVPLTNNSLEKEFNFHTPGKLDLKIELKVGKPTLK